MNKWLATGRLCADPTVKYSQGENQTCIATFTLAVDRKYKKEGQPSADFMRCVAYGKIAEHIEKYWHKGMKADIVSHIKTGSYTDKNGNTVYTTDAEIEEISFGESKNAQGTNTVPQETSDKPDDGFMNVPDELDSELPFA